MAKIRADLIGAVHVDGHVLWADDAIPAGVSVHESLVAPAPKQSKKDPAKRGKKIGEAEVKVVPSESTADPETQESQ